MPEVELDGAGMKEDWIGDFVDPDIGEQNKYVFQPMKQKIFGFLLIGHQKIFGFLLIGHQKTNAVTALNRVREWDCFHPEKLVINYEKGFNSNPFGHCVDEL